MYIGTNSMFHNCIVLLILCTVCQLNLYVTLGDEFIISITVKQIRYLSKSVGWYNVSKPVESGLSTELFRMIDWASED